MAEDRSVRNCKDPFKFRCPQKWDQLQRTESESVRFCTACREPVYFCTSDRETIAHARQGHCIAREMPAEQDVLDIVLGGADGVSEEDEIPSVELPLLPEERRAQDQRTREQGIALALAEIRNARRSCPKCSYPVSDSWTDCRVCGHHLGRL